VNELKADKKNCLMRSGKIFEDTYKIENVKDIITCPHCRKLIGITKPEVRVIGEREEIPLYAGDCVDCKFLYMFTKKEIKEANYHSNGDEETKDEDKFIARCEIQGNVNPIFFSEKDLKDKTNDCADEFAEKIKEADAISDHYYCYAFKKRDKKIDIDKL
jgi:hypothetical protein